MADKRLARIYKDCGSKFIVRRTGFDIGSAQNCTLAYLEGSGAYKMLLPDDDLMLIGSLKLIFNRLDIDKKFACIIASTKNVRRIPYTTRTSKVYHSGNFDYELKKEFCFLDYKNTGLIEAQNYIFNGEISSIYYKKNLFSFGVDEMSPALMLLLCTKLDYPAIYLN